MANQPLDSSILSIKEVALYLKLNERTIYRLATAKKIPAFKVGGTWRFRQANLETWIALQSNTSGTADGGSK